MASGGKKTPSSTASSSTNATKTTTIAGLNQPANDGKFQFTVTSVQCNQPEVGSNQYLTKTAQGQYCLLNLSVKNIGNEAQTLDASNQYIFNSQGQKFSADSTASIYANPSDSTFLDSINPGNSVTGIFAFDLPKGVTPTYAILHDSAFSDGVKVNLQ